MDFKTRVGTSNFMLGLMESFIIIGLTALLLLKSPNFKLNCST